MVPTCPTYKAKHEWIKPLALFLGGEDPEDPGVLFKDWVENGILVSSPQARSMVGRSRNGHFRKLFHVVMLNIVPAREYRDAKDRSGGVVPAGVVSVVPGNNPNTNQGRATVEIREFR